MPGPPAAWAFVNPVAAAQTPGTGDLTQCPAAGAPFRGQVSPSGPAPPTAISVQLTDMQISLIISSSKINYILQ